MIRFYRFPMSTNCHRVSMALAHKGIETESVAIDPGDRSEIRRISGQDLVPVIDHDGRILNDSMEIVRYLEEHFPDEPLYPTDAARLSEMKIFIDWFNRVWKRAPNEMEAELQKPEPARARVERLGARLRGHLDLFEEMLAGRDYLMGEFSAADIAAYPFLRYALFEDEGDPWLFHKILVDWQALGEDHPRLEAWIRRVRERPQV